MSEWTTYTYQPAPRVLCQFRRIATGETFVANPEDLHPTFNVAGLEWKLTGIGSAQLEAEPWRSTMLSTALARQIGLEAMALRGLGNQQTRIGLGAMLSLLGHYGGGH